MRSYTVHRKRKTIGKPLAEAEATVFVRDGFSWPALLVPVLWPLYHRMWLATLGYIAVLTGAVAGLAAAGMPGLVTTVCGLSVHYLFAAEAHSLERWSLARRGYDIVAIIVAPTRDEAELRYFRDWHAAIVAHRNAHEAGDEVQIAFRTRTEQPEQPVVGLFPDDRPT